MDGFFPNAAISHWVGSVGFVLTTWLGAYLASHVPRSLPSRLAILSLFTLSGYFLHVILCLFLPADQIGHIWRRFMGWLALLPLPLWLHLTCALLPPKQHSQQRHLIWLVYLATGLLSVAWIFGSWSFSRITLLPPGLIWPIAIFVTVVGLLALNNIWNLSRQAADATLQLRYTLLGIVILCLMLWILFWPITVNWLRLPWSPSTGLAIGDSLPLAAAILLAYTVAYHSAFMAGRWVKRDFFFHAVTVGAIAGIYFLTLWGAHILTNKFGFDTLTLTLIAVVGLSLLTHLLAERIRTLWDSLFFKQLQILPGEMSGLVRTTHLSGGRLERQMRGLVNRLRDLSGASIVCVALREGSQWVVKASTSQDRIGQTVPLKETSNGVEPKLDLNISLIEDEGHRHNLDCLVLAEPIFVNDQTAGYLLLGERGVGEGYNREERVWISALATHLSVALEQAQRREENAQLIADLKAEAKALAAQEETLEREFENVLSGPPLQIDAQELREAIYAYNQPDQLAVILAREESTLSSLPNVTTKNGAAALSLQQQLTNALDAITPDVLPSLESLRNRSMRAKRRRHLPTPVANYHTLRLAMDGHTHEAIAEMLEVSPRQVRNYLDRAINSLKVSLEQQIVGQ